MRKPATSTSKAARPPQPKGAAALFDVALPVDVVTHLLLFAQRRTVDGTVLRSNPLIVSIIAGPP